LMESSSVSRRGTSWSILGAVRLVTGMLRANRDAGCQGRLKTHPSVPVENAPTWVG
jgi:hypothetical protein